MPLQRPLVPLRLRFRRGAQVPAGASSSRLSGILKGGLVFSFGVFSLTSPRSPSLAAGRKLLHELVVCLRAKQKQKHTRRPACSCPRRLGARLEEVPTTPRSLGAVRSSRRRRPRSSLLVGGRPLFWRRRRWTNVERLEVRRLRREHPRLNSASRARTVTCTRSSKSKSRLRSSTPTRASFTREPCLGRMRTLSTDGGRDNSTSGGPTSCAAQTKGRSTPRRVTNR